MSITARVVRLLCILASFGAAARCGATAPSCSYTVSPTAAVAPPGGGIVNVTVTTGTSCSWVVVSNTPWLFGNPNATIGSGQAVLLVLPNREGGSRSGTATVAGQTIQFTQAVTPAFTLSGVVAEAFMSTGLAGVTVSLIGPVITSVVTDAAGSYRIPDLLPGTYQVGFSKSGYSANTQPLTLAADTTFPSVLSLTTPFPVRATDLTGYWSGGGPYPDSPFRLALIQNGSSLSGSYRDVVNTSTNVTGTLTASDVLLRVDVGTGVITLEGHVDDPRQARGFIKNEPRGGNFPFTMIR
jgi:hypothetical protein